MKITLAELAKFVRGELLNGEAAAEITGFASLAEAGVGDLSFFHDERYERLMADTRASAVLVPVGWAGRTGKASCIAVGNPSRCFEQVVEEYGFQPEPFVAGVHESAVIAADVEYDPAQVSIGPNAVIDAHAWLDAGVQIGAGCYVGKGARIGGGSKIHANVTVHAQCILGRGVILHSGVVIGGDGFGYEFEGGRHRKIRQAGIVQIDDDVEIGAGTTVDRARFGRTWIGEGTKIDNLVQVGHNVVIGKHCIIVACSAIAGSAVVEDYVVVAAQVGIGGHVVVGTRSRLGARCGVTHDLAPGKTYLGFPAVPAIEEKRRIASMSRLPKLFARVRKLERGEAHAEGPNGNDDA